MKDKGNPFHILVADDEETIRKTLQTVLQQKGYQITTAENGLAALKVLGKSVVDLVVMDLKMPGMDGFELLSKIRGLSEQIPVVVITGYADVESTARALKSGASDFLAKPFGAQDIFHSVSRLLELRETDMENKRVVPYLRYNLSMDIPSSSEYIHGAIHFVMEPIKAVNLCEPIHFTNLNIAFYEGMVNAIIHGNGGDKSKKVSVAIDVTYERARVTIRDEGAGFSPGDVESPLASPNIYKANGRGIYLIKHFVDEMFHNNIGNEITMVKKRSSRLAANIGTSAE
jgi:CheY-like chemotaxis protein/anti-sigma regulatory factor (Ser/Thr protein kinase)